MLRACRKWSQTCVSLSHRQAGPGERLKAGAKSPNRRDPLRGNLPLSDQEFHTDAESAPDIFLAVFSGGSVMNICDDLEYRETLASFRHYSNFRLAILTLFFTMSGGVGALLFWDNSTGDLSSLERILCLCASVLSVAFGGLEWILSRYLTAFETHLKQYHSSHFNRLAATTRFRPTYVFRGVYVLVALIWFFAAVITGP